MRCSVLRGNLPVVLLLVLFLVAVPGAAYASDGLRSWSGDVPEGASSLESQSVSVQSAGKDIMLGVFFNSKTDWTNSIYASYNGTSLFKIAEAYKGGGINKPYLGNHYAQYDPSIIYHDGYFWSLSGWNKNDGKIWLMISYSKDLVHWTHPEGSFVGNGISVDSYPVGLNGKTLKAFDTVAPEWFVSKNGSIYIVVSAGYYGDFHGQPTKDAMQAYSIKVKSLSASDGSPAEKGYLWPRNLKMSADKAKKLPFTNSKSADFIDGAFYNDNGTDYLIIKKDGLTNQLYKTSNIDNVKGWKLVNKCVSRGYEGPSIAKIAGKYVLFGDHVTGATADGVKMTSSKSLTKTGKWAAFQDARFVGQNGKSLTARHGSVLTLKAGTDAWRVVKDLLDEKIKTSKFAPKVSIAKTASAKRAFTVKWKAQKTASGYQVRYATSKGMGNAKTSSASAKKSSLTVKKVKAGGKYYVQLRSVQKIGDKSVYSAWSKVKAVSVKK